MNELALDKILVSSCLLGEPVRYDSKSNRVFNDYLNQWQSEGRLVPICPEVIGGLSVPRPAAEIQFGDGHDVLAGGAQVRNVDDQDESAAFIKGAHSALALAKKHDCRFALLAKNSPSCGNYTIHDGHFVGRLKLGLGVTAALLTQYDIQVFNQSEINQLATALDQ